MKGKSRFLIDLSRERVFCISCKGKCRCLHLRQFSLFWCGAKSCANADEVRLYPGSVWKVFAVSETLGEHSISEVTAVPILSFRARDERLHKLDETRS